MFDHDIGGYSDLEVLGLELLKAAAPKGLIRGS